MDRNKKEHIQYEYVGKLGFNLPKSNTTFMALDGTAWCRVCGTQKVYKGANEGWRCLACKSKCDKYSNYLKTVLVTEHGCGCNNCGYNEDYSGLEFHHIDATDKAFHLASKTITNNNINGIRKELDKCILLCATCHRVVHSKDVRIEGNRISTPETIAMLWELKEQRLAYVDTLNFKINLWYKNLVEESKHFFTRLGLKPFWSKKPSFQW